MSNTTEIQKVNVTEITATMALTSQVLVANESLADKAVKGAQQLLDTIEAEGMSDELDSALNAWQLKAKSASVIMNDRRSPITQVMTRMAKMFTELENKLDPSKTDSVFTKIQKIRNGWAQQKALEAKQKADAILKQQNVAKERISIVADIHTQIRKIYNGKLLQFLQAIQTAYGQLTLENAEEIKKNITVRPVTYPVDKFRELTPSVFALYLEKDELESIIAVEREKLYVDCAADFKLKMEAEKANVLELIPSRLKELRTIAEAGEAEKLRLEGIATQRTLDAANKLKQDAKEAEEKSKLEIANATQMSTAGVLFDATAQMAEIKEEKAKVREGYKINISNSAGWGAVFMFYFEKEGQKLTVDDFGKKSLNQMKAFCEKHAMKTGEFISSDSLEYEEVFKAVVTKAA